jgi:hypothetical protein
MQAVRPCGCNRSTARQHAAFARKAILLLNWRGTFGGTVRAILRKKLLGSPYRSGRSAHWVKVKNSWLNESPPDAAWSILLAKQS